MGLKKPTTLIEIKDKRHITRTNIPSVKKRKVGFFQECDHGLAVSLSLGCGIGGDIFKLTFVAV